MTGVVETHVDGVIESIGSRGYGFVATRHGSVYFHSRNMPCNTDYASLRVGDRVLVDLAIAEGSAKRFVARRVRKVS